MTGEGTGTIAVTGAAQTTCASSCAIDVPIGGAIHLVPSADVGSWVRGWTETCAGREPCDLTITADTQITLDLTAEPNRFFISSTPHDGNFGGLAGADSFCNATAAAAGLAGTYIAFLETSTASTTNVLNRLGNARGWIRVDGEPIADLATTLVNGALMSALGLDEHGSSSMLGSSVWGAGLGASDQCMAWTTNSGDTGPGIETELAANLGANGQVAFGFTNTACDQSIGTVCVEIDRVVPTSPVPEPGRVSFVAVIPNLGIGLAGVDLQCAADASAAGLPGTYHALLATDQASAASRFDLAGPWVRVDGRPFAAAWLMGANDVGIAPALAADGSLSPNLTVTLGAASTTVPGTDVTTCTNWSNVMGSASANLGAWIIQAESGSDVCSDVDVLCLQDS